MTLVQFLKPGKEYVFCHEDLELAFEKETLESITNDWNSGLNILKIAGKYNRDSDEIFLAIFHQARRGKLKRRLNVSNFKETIGG